MKDYIPIYNIKRMRADNIKAPPFLKGRGQRGGNVNMSGMAADSSRIRRMATLLNT